MTRTEFVSEWINKKGEKIKVYQVDSSAKEYELIGPGKSSSHFFGNYTQLVKKLAAEGYESKTRHESETIDNFMDRALSEAPLKPGQQQKIPANINVKLTPGAKAALFGDPKTQQEKKKIEIELKKHAEEYKKLNAMLNKVRLNGEILKRKHRTVDKTIKPIEAKYFSLIEKQCSQFVSEMKKAKKPLFRGMNSDADVLYGKPHVNRKPTDTNPTIQRKIDDILKAAGFKALRANSIFTTSAVGQAEEYGTIYFIFPKNGYSFTWSSKHYDWIPNLKSLGIGGVKIVDWSLVQYKPIEFFIDTIGDLDEAFNTYDKPQNKKIVASIKKHPKFKKIKKILPDVGGEIENLENDDEPDSGYVVDLGFAFDALLKMQSELKFKWPDITAQHLRLMSDVIEEAKQFSSKNNHITKEIANKFITKHGMKNTDMAAALKSGHEIYINGEYIALDYEMFKYAVDKYFFNKASWGDDDD